METPARPDALATLFELAPDPLCIAEIDGTLRRVNPAFLGLLGWDDTDVTGKRVTELVHADDRPFCFPGPGGHKEVVGTRSRWQCGDGSFRWLEWRWSKGGDGLVCGAARAVTDARDDRYRSLFENHPEAVFSLDLEGCFTSANSACGDLCGYDPADVIGRTFDHLVARDRLGAARVQFSHVLEGHASTFQITLRHRTGRNVEVSITKIPVIVAGKVTEVFGIARDMTTQRALEEQLRHAQKMEAVGQLAAGVAHDFNNVISVIRGCTEFLEASLSGNEDVRADVEAIRDAANRAATLTQHLLAFSRRQVLQPTLLDVNGVIEDLQPMMRRMLGDAIDVETSLAPDIGFVSADSGQFEQVIVNMVLNARDAMPNGGTLHISTSTRTIDAQCARSIPEAAPGTYVCMTIADCGHGMDEITRLRIFEPFFTTKGSGRGTGLGLAITYGTIRQSHGYITVSSRIGKGTTFEVYLPAVDIRAVGERVGHQTGGCAGAASARSATHTMSEYA